MGVSAAGVGEVWDTSGCEGAGIKGVGSPPVSESLSGAGLDLGVITEAVGPVSGAEEAASAKGGTST